MRILLSLLLLSTTAFCAGEEFNGRWDISVKNVATYAWWLEIQGAGTPQVKGSFVSAYNGDLNHIDEISIHGNELRFTFLHKDEPSQVFNATLKGGKLVGTYTPPGRPAVEWTGVRAPAIKDIDDGSWREGKPVTLFNGKDLSGWEGVGGGAPDGWSVADGVLKSTGGAANLMSKQKFWNFKLHAEYRLSPHSNSGIGLRARYEVQVIDDYGRPPNTHSNAALYSRIPPSENASKPAGEWQTYEIRLVGRQVTITINGKTVIHKGTIEGLTAMASDANEGEPGPLSLQGDHGPIEYRNIVVTPLTK
jgi:3-keto-disaccharide hydrolase